jgi:hypothetical protein
MKDKKEKDENRGDYIFFSCISIIGVIITIIAMIILR